MPSTSGSITAAARGSVTIAGRIVFCPSTICYSQTTVVLLWLMMMVVLLRMIINGWLQRF